MFNLDQIVDLPSEKVDVLADIIKNKREGLKKHGLYINKIVRVPLRFTLSLAFLAAVRALFPLLVTI